MLNYNFSIFLDKKEYRPAKFADYNKKEKAGLFFEFSRSLVDDFKNLFESRMFADAKIDLLDGQVDVHKAWLEVRLGKTLEEVKKILSQYSLKEVNSFLKWVYLGVFPKPFSESMRDVERIFSLFGLDQRDIYRLWFYRIYKDLAHLYENEDGKDFTIIVNGDEVRVHKFLLQASSNFYRFYFENIAQDSVQFSDVSGRSIEAIKVWVKFLYTGVIEESVDREILEEVSDAVDPNQIN